MSIRGNQECAWTWWKIRAIELGISLLIRLLEKLFLWFEHLRRSNYSVLTIKKFIRQKQSLDRFKNAHKPRKGVSPCTVCFVTSTWFLMSSSLALFLPSVKKHKHDFLFRLMYNKTIIRFGFCHIQNNRDSVSVISLSLRLRLITPTSILIILDITKNLIQ